MEIGHLMKSSRKLKGFTVARMADLMNVSQPTIVRWENGTIDVPSSVLMRFIETLDLTPSEFFAETQEHEPLPSSVRQVMESIKKLTPQKLKILKDVLDTWIETD